MNIVEKVRIFALAAHSAIKQVRKYTNEPYFVHPLEVASMVESVGGTHDMIAASFLHDVVEDANITLEIIQQEFGDDVANLVEWLTDVSKPSDGNRAARKKIDRDHIAQSPPEVQTIKLADLISNTQSIVQHDPKFAKIYLMEKKELLKVLTKGDRRLYDRANDLLDLGLKQING